MQIMNVFLLVQETEAFALYREALSLQRQGDSDGAERVFRRLLETDLLQEVV